MLKKDKKLLKEFGNFVQELEKKDNFLLMAHGDVDGLCSSVISSFALEKLTGKKSKHFRFMYYGEKNIKQKLVKFVKSKKINKIIIMDWTIDQTPNIVKALKKKVDKIIILDHHKIYHDMNSKKVLMIKPQMVFGIDGSKYPASKLCYDLFSKYVDLSEKQWVALVGLIGDSSEKKWKTFVNQTLKKYKLKKPKKIRSTLFGKIVESIEAMQAIKPKNFHKVLQLFLKAKNPRQILKGSLKNYSKKLRERLKYWLKKFKAEKLYWPELELMYFKFNSKYFIKSPLINLISWKYYPKKTVLIAVERDKTNLKISGRRQDFKIKVNELLETSIKNLKKANAGGHIPAAAGIIKKKDEKKFLENVINYLKKQYK